MKRLQIVIAYLVFALTLLFPVSVFADGDPNPSGGCFALAAVDSEGMVIAPCLVEYEDGMTIRDALSESGHTFYNLEANWINTIDGHTDNYVRSFDGGAYNLDLAASEIHKALMFGPSNMEITEDHLSLVKLLAEHDGKEETVKKYRPVKNAYEAAIKGLETANGEKAKTLADNLNTAYAQYEAWTQQEKCAVTVKPFQNGTNVSAQITLTDTMGNEYSAEGTEFQANLLEETYEFVIRKGCHEVSGTFQIAKEDRTRSLSPALPYGNWFGEITLRDTDGIAAECETTGDTTTAKLLDTTYSPYITITPGPDLPVRADGSKNTTDYSLFSEHTSFDYGKYYGDESDPNLKISWNATSKRLVEVAEAGLTEKNVRLKAVHKDAQTGYTQRQYHDLVLKRIPTLKGLKVSAGQNELNLSPEFSPRTTSYSAETISDSVKVTGYSFVYHDEDPKENCGLYEEGYRVSVNGQEQEENGSVEVPVNGTPVQIKVTGTNGFSSSCELVLRKSNEKTIVVKKPSAITEVALKTSTGSILLPDAETEQNATFYVAPGTYTWITTLDEFYHASGSVTTGNGSVTVSGAEPKKEQLLKGLALYSGITTTAVEYSEADGRPFSWTKHNYKYRLSDFATSVYIAASFDEGVSVKREAYQATSGMTRPASDLTSEKRHLLAYFISQGDRNNSFALTASKTSGAITYYQDYRISTQRFATLDSLQVFDASGNPLQIFANGNPTYNVFDSDITEYVLKVGEAADSVTLKAGFSNPTQNTDAVGEETIRIGSKTYRKSKSQKTISQDVPLDRSLAEEDLYIEVFNDREENAETTYHVKVQKTPPACLTVETVPDNATVYVTESISGNRVLPNEDGTFPLLSGFQYTYTATAYGYVGERGTVSIASDQTIQVALTKATENPSIDSSITAEWPYFRADETNNGVVDFPVPIDPENAELYWAKRVGEGYSGNAVGCPIIADGYLYTYSGKRIVKMDPMTGEVKAEGTMYTGSSFAINSPTYAEGMIFIGLSNGGIQAFNAKTLESLWIYKDVLGGQPNCHISYKNGYIYTGYWNSETKKANFVCLSVTDEKPNLEREEKYPVWTYTGNGFYWAGAYVSDRFVIIGTDDGDPGYSKACGTLLSLDPLTGEVIDQIDNQFTGDIRSSICFVEETGTCYFETKSGLFCSVKVNADGTFRKETVTRLQLKETGGKNGVSTSTPVVHNGRAYVGVSGTSSYAQYTGHNIAVIDLTGTKPQLAYRVPTQGYPQTSGLLTTAYEADGSVYVYFFDNFTPGKLRMIKDKPGQTAPDPETLVTESYELNGKDMTCDVAKPLLTPFGEQAQYAICSPIADQYGNLYFKNDSAYMMMLGAKITSLSVKKQPDKTEYIVGEVFDPEGMEVTATYANGMTRDVTPYIEFDRGTLTKEDTTIDLVFDIGPNMKLYQDHEGKAGTFVTPPQTFVNVTVEDAGFIPENLSEVELSESELEYTGEELHPEILRINGKENLIEGTDYTVTWPEASVEPGTYTVKVTGIGTYRGKATATYRIKQTKAPTPIESLELNQTEFSFNGKVQKPEITLINDTDKLKENIDYTVTWPARSVDPGDYTVTVSGIGDYTGTASAAYKINPADKTIVLKTLELSKTEFYFNGLTQKPEIRRINGSSALIDGEDYEVVWPDESTEEGTYTVKVTGRGRFEGEVTAIYRILPEKESEPITKVRLTRTSFRYNGKEQRPEISYVNENYDLEEGYDYVVEWPEKSVNAGTYTVKVKGIGDYSGEKTAQYTIDPIEMSYMRLSKTSFVYNGKVQRPTVSVMDEDGDAVPVSAYTVSWPKNPVNAGTYTVKVSGNGNGIGTLSARFTIGKAANTLSVKPVKKTIKAKKKVKISIAAKGGAKISWKASKGKKSVKLIKKGSKYYVQGRKKGKAVITITSAETANYKKATKKITITVK